MSANFRDPDGDRLTHTAASSNAGVLTVSVSGSVLTLVAVAPGSATVTVTATDPGGLAETQQLSVTVEVRVSLAKFLITAAAAPENGTAVLPLLVTPAPESPIRVNYRIGVDTDIGTEDADTLDYEGEARGTVAIEAGDSVGSITLAIIDDDDIEPAREVLIITLDMPGPDAGYALGASTSATLTIEEGVCDRTPQIRDEIMKLADATVCSGVDNRHLAGIAELNLCPSTYDSACDGTPITVLRERDFLGLMELAELGLGGNHLTDLPDGVFSGLSNLGVLDIQNNRLVELPAGVFSGLANVWVLFAGGNQLESLPPAMFVGLAKLRILSLERNPGSPFPLTLELLRTDNEDLRAPGPATVGARVVEGAPFTIRLPLSAQGGTLSGDTAVIRIGSVESDVLTVTRGPDSPIGTLVAAGPAPDIPEEIHGISISLPQPQFFFASPAPVVSLASNAASAPEGGKAILEIQVEPTPESLLTVRYSLGLDDDDETDDAEPRDYIDRTGGTIQIAAGATSVSIEIDIEDDLDIEPTREVFTVNLEDPGNTTDYVLGHPRTAAVTIEEGVCDRTPQVRDEIVRQARGAGCASVRDTDLSSITALQLDPTWARAGEVRDGEGLFDCGGQVQGRGNPGGSYGWGPAACESEDAESTRRSAGGRNVITRLQEDDFTGLSNLGWLNLGFNEITRLPPGVFSGLSNLGGLRLIGNGLAELPPGIFSGLSRLRDLNVGFKNQLSTLPPDVFEGLSELRVLLLNDSEKQLELPPGIFSGLSNLETLWLNGNEITHLRADVFSDLARLTELWIWWNELTELPPGVFSGLRNLKRLLVNRNRLTELLPDVFSDLVSVEDLGVQFNQLTGLPPDVFSGLSNLRVLGLLENELTALPPDVFSGLSNLRVLGLLENELTALPPEIFSGLSKLERLGLHFNQLEQLPPGVFSDLSGMRELYLPGNRLTQLQTDVFAGMSGMESLDLRWNQLSELPAGVFAGLRKMRTLSIGGNPGAPFTLALKVERADSDNLMAPAPARVDVRLAEGAPFSMTIPLTVHGGGISASRVVLEAGSDRSAEVTVTRGNAAGTGTQVVAGPPPTPPGTVTGIELAVPDPLVLFGMVSNRAPVGERQFPWLRMREGGESSALTASSYFRDPDGDDLTFTAVSADPGVATATVAGGRVTVDPVAAGSGAITVTATDPGGLAADLSLPISVRGGSPGSYDIDLILIDDVSESIQAAFDDAVDYWSAILAPTELSDMRLGEDFELGCWDIKTDQRVQTVEEVVIVASVREIDGRSGILASAGPCGIRDGEGGLPFMGAMEFDVADLEWLEEQGDMEEVILHEMGHVFGLGAFWRQTGLLINPSLPDNQGVDTHFAGPLAIAAFDEAGGIDYEGAKVPVENRAGQGSGDSHWRETVLDHELMTPFQNGGIADPLSTITIQSLADLGYKVNAALAEPFRLPGAGPVPDIVGPVKKIAYGDDILRGPIIVVDPDGRVVRVIPN